MLNQNSYEKLKSNIFCVPLTFVPSKKSTFITMNHKKKVIVFFHLNIVLK